MAEQPIVVFGDHNIAGQNLTNVGNRTYVVNVTHSERDGLRLLESKVAFDALLNAKERYPAPRCHPNTRNVAQAVIKGWIRRKGYGSEKGIMWMSGAPGVGKSAMMQTTCEVLGSDDGSKSWLKRLVFKKGHVDGSFFFGKGLGDRENASFFPLTIAYQLARSRASCNASINKAIEKDPSILDAAFPVQFRELVLKPAKGRWSFQDPLIIVVDALDECNSPADQVALLELIFEASTTTNTRFLIASRPEQGIASFFRRKDVAQHTFHVELDNESFNTSLDIETFLRIEFARIRLSKPELCKPLPNGEEWPGNVVIYRLRDESDSQFIFSRLAINYIDTPHFSPDEQLQSLLEAPPPDAFSNLDTLYHRILSSRPPKNPLRDGDREHNYEGLILGILEVVIAWPGGPFSAAQIASIIKEKADVVQNVVRGPMRSLFKFDMDDPDSPITLCHKSLRDYLLDRNRSKEFFIASSDADGLFMGVLSRKPPSDPFRCYSRDDLIDVLTALVVTEGRSSISDIASGLHLDINIVERVIHGPSKSLFEVEDDMVSFSLPSFLPFLVDVTRAGQFFVPTRDPSDAFLIRVLSRQAPADKLHSYPRNSVMLGVLTVILVWPKPVTASDISSILDLPSSLVEARLFGHTKSLFNVDKKNIVTFASDTLTTFLLDANRAENFFIPNNRPEGLFTQVLSRPLPLDHHPTYSRDVLMGVLSALVVWEGGLTVDRIAAIADVGSAVVQAVLAGPTKSLFLQDDNGNIRFSTSKFGLFLQDEKYAGQFHITRHAFFARILSRQPPIDSLHPYNREALMGVIKVLVVWSELLTISQIASTLNVAPVLVEDVVFGPARGMFAVDDHNKVAFSTPFITPFLLDADRAGEFSIPSDSPDGLFTEILAREPPLPLASSHPFSRDTLRDVLMVLVLWAEPLNVLQIASALDISPSLVEGVVFGPTEGLFKLDDENAIKFSSPSLKSFLLDADRAGAFFISSDNPDELFTQILSRSEPHPDPSQPHSREMAMAVLRVVMSWAYHVTVPEMATVLDVPHNLVDGIVFGPTKSFFKVDGNGYIHFSTPLIEKFLLDANRAGEFFLSDHHMPSAFYAQILSRQPPSNPSQSYSREVLMGVLTVVAALERELTAPKIASVLNIAPALVEAVIFGPARALFALDDSGRVRFFLAGSTSTFRTFLHKAEVAGDFYIPEENVDNVFIQILSREPPSDPLQSYSRETLIDVLTVFMCWHGPLTVPQIAFALDIDPVLVQNVVSGPVGLLLYPHYENGGIRVLTQPHLFLESLQRAGDFYISTIRSGKRDGSYIRTRLRQILPRHPSEKYLWM